MQASVATEEPLQLDVTGPEYKADPYGLLDRARQSGSIFKSERGWEVLDHDLAAGLLKNPRLSPPDVAYALSRGASPILASFKTDGLLKDLAPDKHRRIRRVMNRAFELRRIDQRKEVMHAVGHSLVDNFIDKGECEFIGEFSHHYSINVLCSLLGVDEKDIPHFDHATTELKLMSAWDIEPVLPRIDAALQTLWDYSTELVARRRAELADDFISGLIEAQRTEGQLSETELIWGIANLLFAGHETTRSQLALVMRVLAEQPAFWTLMDEDPAAIPGVMYEALRYYPVIQSLIRIVREPIKLGPYELKPDEVVILNMLAVSRDPAKFEHPDIMDPSRPTGSYSIAFGKGIHHCVGHALAKAEMLEGLTVLRDRLKTIELNGPLEFAPFTGQLGGVAELRLKFQRR